MATKNSAREALESRLAAAVSEGLIVDYKGENPTGNKLVWNLSLSESVAAALVDYDVTKLESSEVKAFLAGAAAAIALPQKKVRHRQPNPLREAIQKDGRVEVDVPEGATATEVKTLRNKMFLAAYGAGYKGKFKVRTTGDGKLVGEVQT